MRYIRTKDGRIIKIGEQTDTGFDKGTIEIHNKTGIAASYEPFEVLKEADTVEELCDEFVVENPEKDIHDRCCDLQDVFDWVADLEIPIGIKHFDEERGLISGEHDWNVYGAIWTEHGLKYIAKMNEKGELELL